MKILKIIGKALYVIILLAIIINGIIGIGKCLENIGINGFLNSLLTYSLSIYGISMFFYDIQKIYKEKE